MNWFLEQAYAVHLKYNENNMALERSRNIGVPESSVDSRRILAVDYGRKKIGLALSDLYLLSIARTDATICTACAKFARSIVLRVSSWAIRCT